MSEMNKPTNGWQTMDSCPRIDYEMYLTLVPREDGSLVHAFALWDPEIGEFNTFERGRHENPVYWQHLPPKPGETLKSDEERQRLFDEEMALIEVDPETGHVWLNRERAE